MTDNFGNSNMINAALERFIELQSTGSFQNIDEFLSQYPEEMRSVLKERVNKLKKIDQILFERSQTNNVRTNDLIGAKLLNYKLIEKIGQGGMGIVYLAEDVNLNNRKVAIKVLPEILSNNKIAIENLRSEAYSVIQLNHPNIIRLYGLFNDNSTYFLAMEHVDGITLSAKIANSVDEKLSLNETLNIANQVADALDYAHTREKPVIHRDLKPSNVMISQDGKVKVLDFGIACQIRETLSTITGLTNISGTPPYMSPEQIKGQLPCRSMDIYSFGITLYECLSGKVPFYTGDLYYQILFEKPKDLENVPINIMNALHKALDKCPANRPSSARILIDLFSNPNNFDSRSTLFSEETGKISKEITLENYCHAKYKYVFSKELENHADKLLEVIDKKHLRTSMQVFLDHIRAAYLELISIALSRTISLDLREKIFFIQSDFLRINNVEYIDSIWFLYNKAFGSNSKDGVLEMANCFYQVALRMPKLHFKRLSITNTLSHDFGRFINKLFDEIESIKIV